MSGATGQAISSLSDPYEELYRSEFVRAVQLAHLLTGTNASAEDIAQEAFLGLRPRFTLVDQPVAYLRRTIVNLARNWHRSDARRMSRERRLHAVDVAGPVAAEHEHVLAAVDRLPYRQRAVLVARYWLDLSEADIASMLGCRPGTVKSLASRALSTLRKELP